MLAEATVINLFALLQVFPVGLGNRSEFFSFFQSKRIQRFEGKLNICKGKQLSVPERAGVTSLVGKKQQAKDSRG